MVRERRDYESWMQGLYIMRSVSVPLSHMFGKHSKLEYFKEPVLAKAAKDNEENLTEEQIAAERKKLLLSLQAMQASFELNHSGEPK